ncbi:hypothetical protein EMCRGX_G001521 [Ephydatia muelleri]
MSENQCASDDLPHDEERGEATQPMQQTHPEAGLKTSDFYKTESLPERFNHPDWFVGYGTQPQNSFFRTTAMSYGSKPLSVHTMPTEFYGRTQKFSEKLGKVGMYRNHSLNTAVDRSRV